MDPYSTPYGKTLRSIGQALEVLHLEAFELESEGDDCLVRGELQPEPLEKSSPQDLQKGALPGIWRRLRSHESKPTGFSPAAQSTVSLELCYTRGEIAQLESEGRARRCNPHGIPDPQNLSQILRAVGTYLDGKGVRLLGLSRQFHRVTLHYELGLRRRQHELLPGSFLHDILACMYLQRPTGVESQVHAESDMKIEMQHRRTMLYPPSIQQFFDTLRLKRMIQ